MKKLMKVLLFCLPFVLVPNSTIALSYQDVYGSDFSHPERVNKIKQVDIQPVAISPKIFMPHDFTYVSMNVPTNLPAKYYDKYLANTPIAGHGWVFEKIEKATGVNGVFLFGITGAEQTFGKSESKHVLERNNYTSIRALDRDHNKSQSFDDLEDCIRQTAILLKRDYFTKGGKYYTGNKVQEVNSKFSSTPTWYKDVLFFMHSLTEIYYDTK